MPEELQIILAVAIILGIGYLVYRFTRSSGGSTGTGGYTKPGKPGTDWDRDPR